jgi:hypothetical protein
MITVLKDTVPALCVRTTKSIAPYHMYVSAYVTFA